MKRNQQKRPVVEPARQRNGSNRPGKSKPGERPGWMRDAELDRSINAAVQDGDQQRER